MKKFYTLSLFFLLSISAFSQAPGPDWYVPPVDDPDEEGNVTDPFCAGGSEYTFPGVAGGFGAGNMGGVDCLGSTPNPVWYYMQIANPGDLVFTLEQTAYGGGGIDVDFAIWGPFDSPEEAQQAVQDDPEQGVVDCSYSIDSVEIIDIPDAQSGEFYLVLITNYNGSAGEISLTQTGGSGSTSCAIVCPISIGVDTEICEGTSTTFDAILGADDLDPSETTYQWYFNGDPIEGATGPSYTASEEGTYSIVAVNPGCITNMEASVELTYAPPVVVEDPENLEVCASATSTGPYTYDLTENDEVITEGQDPNDYYITYFNTAQEADEGGAYIFPASVYQSNGNETIYARIEDNLGCYTVKSFQLLVSPAPQPASLPDIYMCDLDENGSETFDLSQQDALALAGLNPNNYYVKYFTSNDDAIANTGDITDPTAYTSTGETIFVRTTNVNNVDCYSVANFDVIVSDLPDVQAPADAYACSNDPYVLPDLVSGNYFDQTGGEGTEYFAGDVISQSMLLYVYDEVGVAPNICSDEETFTVTIIEKPEVDEPVIEPVCNSYILPSLGTGDYYTEPGGAGDMLPAGTEITETTTLYIYAENGSADTVICSDEYAFNITITSPPSVVEATPLEACDDNNDGIAVFDLTEAGDEVVNGQNNLMVSYHETFDDASINGANPIPNPDEYSAIVPTVYIRVAEPGAAEDCASVVPVELIVHDRPVIPEITDYELCDYNNSPDGVEIFDLTTKDAEATTEPTDIVSYYTSEEEAEAGDTPITNAATYESTTATVWVRVENTFSCYTTAPVNLVVNPLPEINMAMEPLYACEETPGQGVFDLSVLPSEILQQVSGFAVTNYINFNDADQGNDNMLGDTYTAASSVIYTRVENVETGCYIVTETQLEVLPAPIAPELDPLQECDSNNDGFAMFDLNTALNQIYDALGDVDLSVHETYDDAVYDANPVDNVGTYTNVNYGGQTLWIRVQAAQTDCFDIAELQLIVNPVPEAVTPGDYALCDNGQDDTDGQAIFDLGTVAEEVLGGLDPSLYSVSYYDDETNAENGVSPITTPGAYLSPTSTVYIRVTENATGCYDVVALELIVNPLPVVSNPVPYSLCDEDNPGDEQEVFDLTTKIDEITGGADGVTVTFHDTYQEAEGNTNAIATPDAYTNTATVETLFVRVTDNETGCYRIVLLDVRVEPLPVIVPPTQEDLTACDTNGMGIGVFDLEALIEDMVNNGAGLAVTFHETPEDAQSGLNPITNTEAYQNSDPYLQYLYVRVENTLTGCVNYAPYQLTLIVEPAPQAPAVDDLTQCDDTDNNGQDGQAYFDLTV
ncbi:hypothetical protein ABS766_16220, partial [Flavobacterium sp. ST-119]